MRNQARRLPHYTLAFAAAIVSLQGALAETPRAASGPVRSMPAANVPVAPSSVSGTVLAFPTKFSAGSLYRVRFGHEPTRYARLTREFFAAAKGNVEVPADCRVGLTVSYQAAEDLSFLDKLAPGALVYLKFERLPLSDEQFMAMKILRTIRGLELTDVDVSDNGFTHIRDCGRLEALTLKAFLLTAKGMNALRDLKSLRMLELEQGHFGNAGLSAFSRLNDLVVLHLKDVGIDDDGLKYLAPLQHLEDLGLAINKITDKGVVNLLPLKSLKRLNLTDTKITVACADTLAKLPNLVELRISHLDFSPAQVAQMQRKLPGCKIIDGRKTGTDMSIFNPLH